MHRLPRQVWATRLPPQMPWFCTRLRTSQILILSLLSILIMTTCRKTFLLGLHSTNKTMLLPPLKWIILKTFSHTCIQQWRHSVRPLTQCRLLMILRLLMPPSSELPQKKLDAEGFTNDPLSLETPQEKPKSRRGCPRKGENVLTPMVNYNTRSRISISEATITAAASASAKFHVDDNKLASNGMTTIGSWAQES